MRVAGDGGPRPRAPRERRARGAPRRNRHVRASRRAASLRLLPPRPAGRRRGLRRRAARARPPRGGRRRAPPVVLRPRRPRRTARRLRTGARPRLGPGHDSCVERQGALLRGAPPARPARAEVRARPRRRSRRPGCARARLPGPAGLLQAGRVLGLARLPRARRERRPGAPAAERAPRLGLAAPRGGARAPSPRGWRRSARHGARAGRRAHDRRRGRRAPRRPRAPEDARGDARRPRDVLRHAGRPRAHGAREPDRGGVRDRALLQHPARRRPRDRDQPAHLHDRLPGGPEPPVPRREARARGDLGRRARGARRRACGRAAPPCASSTSSSGIRDAARRPLPREHRGRSVDERPGAPPAGSRRPARRLQPLPAAPGGRRLARAARRLRAPSADAVVGARATRCRARTCSTSTSG